MREAYRRQKQQLNKDNVSVILFFIYTGKEKMDFQTAVEKMNVVISSAYWDNKWFISMIHLRLTPGAFEMIP